jgi:hypothetical protein
VQPLGDLDPDWLAFRDLANRLAAQNQGDAGSVFDPIGLLLPDPGETWSAYDVTPVNSITFAHTGGDGVHYGFLHDESGRRTAVVMTVPMAFDEPNYIVGTSLRDFLSLGCRTGYFSIEQLAYDYAGTSSFLQEDSTDLDVDNAALLTELTRVFDLKPWPAVAERLSKLDAQLRRSIRLEPDGR